MAIIAVVLILFGLVDLVFGEVQSYLFVLFLKLIFPYYYLNKFHDLVKEKKRVLEECYIQLVEVNLQPKKTVTWFYLFLTFNN